MFWNANVALQLARLIPSARERLQKRREEEKKIPHSIVFLEGGCGCCPVCREFVYLEPVEEGEVTPCPRCGSLVSALDPLGSAPSK